MTNPLRLVLYIVMLAIGLVAMYSILNAGNPESMLRPYFPNPAYDVYIALGSSFTVFILGFFVFYSRDREGFQQIIKLNEKRIREQRRKGKSDEQIAESILSAMGTPRGYRHKMSKKKLIAYLSEFKK